MYRIEWKKEWPSLVLIGLMFLAGAIFYDVLPDRLPMHWNIQGQVDRYADKSILTAFMFPLIALGTLLLMLYLPYIDPKREKYGNFLRAYRWIRVAIIALFAALYGAIIAGGLGLPLRIEKIVPAAVAVLFIVIGNLMGKIRQNWFVGIKLPWTLASGEVWNKTHRLAGRLFVLAGILGFTGIFLPPIWTFITLLGSILLAVIIPIIYSAVIFKRL